LHAAKAGKRYRLIRHADGSVEIEAKNQADHDPAMNAVERIGPLMDEPYIRRIMAEAAARTAMPVAASPASKMFFLRFLAFTPTARIEYSPSGLWLKPYITSCFI
jgi:hypothetical protein